MPSAPLACDAGTLLPMACCWRRPAYGRSRRLNSVGFLEARPIDLSQRKRRGYMADALSEARNLDVLASALLAPLRAAFPSFTSELEHLGERSTLRRWITHAAARTLIGSTRYRAAKRTLANWVAGCEWRAGGDVELLRRPIGELAPILLARCHRQIRKRGGSFTQLSEEDRHRLRIDLKRCLLPKPTSRNRHPRRSGGRSSGRRPRRSSGSADGRRRLRGGDETRHARY